MAQSERLVREAIRATEARGRLFGVGVGVPGLVDRATGVLLFAPNLGWRDLPLRDLWQPRFGVPVIVENEANAAALGEHMLGAARQFVKVTQMPFKWSTSYSLLLKVNQRW